MVFKSLHLYLRNWKQIEPFTPEFHLFSISEIFILWNRTCLCFLLQVSVVILIEDYFVWTGADFLR